MVILSFLFEPYYVSPAGCWVGTAEIMSDCVCKHLGLSCSITVLIP